MPLQVSSLFNRWMKLDYLWWKNTFLCMGTGNVKQTCDVVSRTIEQTCSKWIYVTLEDFNQQITFILIRIQVFHQFNSHLFHCATFQSFVLKVGSQALTLWRTVHMYRNSARYFHLVISVRYFALVNRISVQFGQSPIVDWITDRNSYVEISGWISLCANAP